MSERHDVTEGGGGRVPQAARYLTFTDPASGQGFWLRAGTGGGGWGDAAGVWFARFHPSDPGRTFGLHRALDVADLPLGAGRAEGSVSGAGHEAAWSLRWEPGDAGVPLLPPGLAGRRHAPALPGATVSDAHVRGRITVDGETLELAAARGQEGRVTGSRVPDGWAWAHCASFEGERASIDLLVARLRRGPLASPDVTVASILWDGRAIRLRKVVRRRDWSLGVWRVDLSGRRYRLSGRVEAPARAIVRARLATPGGAGRFVHVTAIASARLALFERRAGGFEEVALFESRGATQAEWAGRTPAPQVEREVVEATGAGVHPEEV